MSAPSSFSITGSETTINKNPIRFEGNEIFGDDVDEKASGSLFQLRHRDKFSFEPLSIELKSIISDNGTVSADELSKTDAICIATNSDCGREIYKTPQDDPTARIERVRHFLDAAAARAKPHFNYDSFDSVLFDDEKIFCVLNCSHISGLPTQTDDSFTIMGKMKVALVESEKYGSRIIFSVADGSVDVSIQDAFWESQLQKSCICCCFNVLEYCTFAFLDFLSYFMELSGDAVS